MSSLYGNEDIINSQILSYLYNNTDYFKTYKDIDLAFGYSAGYFSKIAKGEKNLMKIHAISLESEYKIPRNLFWNQNIKTTQDIEDVIRKNKHKFKLLVENKAPESLEKFKKYKYFYIYDIVKDAVIKREIKIKNQIIEIFNNNELNFKGFIHTSCASIICITENPDTGNNVIFKVQRDSLIEDIIPISYMGHRRNSNEEVTGYGICSTKTMNDEEIHKIIIFNEAISFSEKKSKIKERIKESMKK